MRLDAPLLSGLPPVIDGRSRLLILGSFPSKKSLEKREYYGNPQNHFWQIMEGLLGIQRQRPYEERVQQLLERSVAVWDVIASCRREGSADDAIEDAVANPISALLTDHPGIRCVVFNGGAAWQVARLSTPELFTLPAVGCERFPSTSPRVQLSAKLKVWSRLRSWLRESA